MIARSQTPQWADGPYKLLEIPSSNPDRVKTSSPVAVAGASEMAHAHNCLLRGLNSIVLQAPYISDATDPDYNVQDVKDLLTYVDAWVTTIDHHHHTEETAMFPQIEEFAKEPGLMQGPQDQHALFHPGLVKLGQYARETEPEDYRWEGESGMKLIITGFADSMLQHLSDEIDVFLSLGKFDEAGLQKCLDHGQEVAKNQGSLDMFYNIMPLTLGCSDKTYDGGNEFPPFPGAVAYAVNYWFYRRNKGAWRFNPCDFWGIPVPLHFLPENQTK